MEDKYLVKAKRTDNREWVVGGLVRYGFTGKEKYYIVPDYASDLYAIEIDPNTICRCTGLKDENGKQIWENDIVKCLYNCYGKKFVYIGKVIYKEDTCRFVAVNSESTDYEWWNEEKEVIGNIFDNPELLRRNDE